MIKNIIRINSIFTLLLGAVLLVCPALRVIQNIRDPALKGPGIPKAVWRLERTLTPRYAAWARERMSVGAPEKHSTNDISGTEWPLFGSVFYLWGVENLQNAWAKGDHTAGEDPKVFCKDSIVAASELVIDPRQASWVQKHWGTNYLHHENLYYRMLVIAALTSREKLLHDGAHLDMLRDQVATLTRELDSSKSGLLDDYPKQCYPGDVMAAIASIQRADYELGTNPSTFVRRSLRAFVGRSATGLKLPPYLADAGTGRPLSDSRGCANSYFCLTAPELWPDQAKEWFKLYEENFWQEDLGFSGFREFPKDVPNRNWMVDVDSGPVIAGFGVSANAFGVGAARKNGRFDLAYPLSAEMLATVWELPNGTLATPRLLSNWSDAPMLGEAAILWLLSEQPEKGFAVKMGGGVPTFVYVVIICALLVGIFAMAAGIDGFRSAGRPPEPSVAAPILQAVIWAVLVCGAIAAGLLGLWLAGLGLILGALVFPRTRKFVPLEDEKPSEPGSPAKS